MVVLCNNVMEFWFSYDEMAVSDSSILTFVIPNLFRDLIRQINLLFKHVGSRNKFGMTVLLL
jgi:hypothetical protein